VRKALGDPQLAVVVGRQFDADPAAEGGRPAADVHRHVEGRPAHHAHQLALRVRRQLVVQAAQHAGPAARMVVLHERARRRQAECAQAVAEARIVPALHEPAAIVGKACRLDDHHAGQVGGQQLHRKTFSPSTCIRYWP
jgi:hypothetical protein